MEWLSDVDVEALLAFYEALAAVENVAKTQTADTGKYTYRYADLGDVLDECKRCCQMFGLAVMQVPTSIEDKLAVQTVLIHKNGGTIPFPPMMLKLPADAQALGSALTYLRRYSLLTIFGIAPADDDGAAATAAVKRQEATGGQYRTGAEQRIHAVMATLEPEQGKALRDDFRTTFGVGLSNLDPSRHGEALTWVHEWLTVERDAGPAPAPDREPQIPERLQEPEDAPPPDVDTDPWVQSLFAMKKAELIEGAAKLEIDIPPNWTKLQIIQAIRDWRMKNVPSGVASPLATGVGHGDEGPYG